MIKSSPTLYLQISNPGEHSTSLQEDLTNNNNNKNNDNNCHSNINNTFDHLTYQILHYFPLISTFNPYKKSNIGTTT